MKTLLFAAVVAAGLSIAGCAADPSFIIPPNHPAHADAPTPPLHSPVTALDAPASDVTTAASTPHEHHAHAAPADASKTAAKPYPLDVCLVSDEKLGEHGKPFVFEHEGQEIKLCCKMCLKDFQKEPAVYLKKLDETNKKPPATAPAGHHHQHKH